MRDKHLINQAGFNFRGIGHFQEHLDSRCRRAQQDTFLIVEPHGREERSDANAQGDRAAQDDLRPIQRQTARGVIDEVQLADGRDIVHPGLRPDGQHRQEQRGHEADDRN